MKQTMGTILAITILMATLCGCSGTTDIKPSSETTNSETNVSEVSSNTDHTATDQIAGQSETQETDDNTLLQAANAVVDAMKTENFTLLASYVHPEKGVTFTPYSTVHLDSDRVMTNTEIETFLSDNTIYQWGYYDGNGEPIKLTNKGYWDSFVWNADYSKADQTSLNEIVQTGNAIENVQEAYPSAKFVDYHFDQINAQNEGMDWCSLKLVFEQYNGTWYLVGIIHSQWTI